MDHIAALFKNHHESLYRFLVRLSGEPDLAADAAQEAFVRLLANPGSRTNERAWLFTVGANYVLERRRTAARRTRLLAGRAEQVMGDPPAEPDAIVEARARHSAALAALSRLSEKERIAVLMREEGFSHREIAEAVGTTTASVGTLLARALARLARETTLGPEAL